MAYRLEITPLAKAQIKSWGLAATHDYLLVEIYLRLGEVCKQPTAFLVRDRDTYDGMVFAFELVDPHNRLCEHAFLFHLVYSRDESTLIVAGAGYTRRIGL